MIGAQKLGAEPKTIPLRDGRYDLDALLEAVTPRTKLVYVCHPNNPTGTMNTRAELDDYFGRVPDHVLTVLDQAYFEYVDDPDYADGVEEYLKTGRRVVVLRTFSKIFGLAGLRVGYGVAPAAVVTAIGKVRRAFDITLPAQVAALASLAAPGAASELERRRRVNAEVAPRSSRRFASTASTPSGPPSRTSSSRRSARTRGRSSSSCFRRASSSGRPRASGRRVESGSRSARRRRMRFSGLLSGAS